MFFWQEQGSLLPYQWVLRAVVIFFWLFLMTKIMGQRQIGRLTLLDFIISIVIGSVAAGSLNSSRNSLTGVLIVIGTLTAIDVLIAYISLKNAKFRRIFQGEPLLLIKDGKIIKDSLTKGRINLDDLLMGLRRKNYPNFHDTEFAILEPNGKISVIPKSQSRPLRPQDLKISTQYEGYPVMVLEDGNIIEDNLEKNNLDSRWLLSELKRQGVEDQDCVMAAMLDTKGKLFISKK